MPLGFQCEHGVWALDEIPAQEEPFLEVSAQSTNTDTWEVVDCHEETSQPNETSADCATPMPEAVPETQEPPSPETQLNQACPTATAAECARFLCDAKQDLTKAAEALTAYLTWRAESVPVGDTTPMLGRELPKAAFLLEGTRDVQGNRCVVALPGLISNKVGSPEEYGHAVSVMLEEIMPHDTEDQFTLLVDLDEVADGENLGLTELQPLIGALSNAVTQRHPGRLYKMVCL